MSTPKTNKSIALISEDLRGRVTKKEFVIMNYKYLILDDLNTDPNYLNMEI